LIDLNNTVIPSINKEDGPKIIAFYKKHGYNISFMGTHYKNNNDSYYYYGVFGGCFDSFSNSDLKKFNLKVLDISIINGELEIWI
jgi:hypothetical protein